MALTVLNDRCVDYWVSRKTANCFDTTMQPESGVNLACKNPDRCREFGCEKDCTLPEFRPFQKIPRLKRTIVITEKIDGTNASITVLEDGRVLAGSRTRWITPEKDNFGFARWVKENEEALRVGLGHGTHYGEWFGDGIQRRYGLTEKRFALFNTSRWVDGWVAGVCRVVPVLYNGPWVMEAIDKALEALRVGGSVAVPGFMRPEGIVVFHSASGTLHKVTLESDEAKGA